MILRQPSTATTAAPRTASPPSSLASPTLPLQLRSSRRRSGAHHRRSRPVTVANAGGPADVFALDFDGVLVDSEPEVSSAAIDAAATFGDEWREAVFGETKSDDAATVAAERRRSLLLEGLRRTRPVLVRGYEAVVMARLLAESLDRDSSMDGVIQRILDDWPSELDAAMRRFFGASSSSSSSSSSSPYDRAPLESHFERRRAAALGGDRAAWLSLNAPYPSRGDALRAAVREEATGPVYFVSSKKAERVSALLQHHFSLEDVHEQSPRLFASLLPPEQEKARALREIASRPVAAAAERLHFVDDRLETLLAVAEDAELAERWTLYLASWGYCAPGEVAEAKKIAAASKGNGVDLRVLRRPEELAELLRWGLVSGGVDDGCEPTEEEKRAEGWL